MAEFANTVDADKIAHNEPSHLDLQCLPSSLYAPNFEKVNGAYCFWSVRGCVRGSHFLYLL